ncbi:MAG: GNAT family N-acetyltransferase [Chloroflexi bacterium]|nr:GNAT family N-acetyltransferase [Chloroflexota bacterium]
MKEDLARHTPEVHLEIRQAVPEDAPELSAIAHAAKAHWGYPQKWMNLWNYSLTILPKYIQDHPVYAAVTEDSKLVGFYALSFNSPRYSLDHLWILPEWMGRGVGKALFQDAVQRVAGLGAQAMEIQADPHAEGFYLHMGASRIGEFVYDLDGEKRVLPLLIFNLEEKGNV